MNQIVWVNANEALPEVRNSYSQDVLAAGMDLSPARLKEAYSKGMFPWFSEGEPVLWWSPNPRMVLLCDELHVSKNFAKLLRRIQRNENNDDAVWKVTTNLAFDNVIQACADLNENRPSTWITSTIKETYSQWHAQGHVNSIEVWHNEQLVGGLYGVLLGRFFFGESMFSKISNASKIALYYLTKLLIDRNINIIDCQQETGHLSSLGAKTVSRDKFLDMLDNALVHATPFWPAGQIIHTGKIVPIDSNA